MSVSENIPKKYRKIFFFQHKRLRSTATIGFIFALMAAIFSALPTVIPKSIMEENSEGIAPHPILIVLIIYLANATFFTPLSVKSNPIRKISKNTILLLILLGLVETSGTLFHTIGLKETTALNASILSNGETIFAVLIGLVIFKEKLSRNEILPFLLIVLGALIIPIGSDFYHHGMQLSEFVIGDIFVLIAGLFYCLDTFIAKHIDHSINTKRMVQVMSGSGAILTLVVMLILDVPLDIGINQISMASLTGFFGIGVTMMFFVIALRMIGAVRTVLIYSTATIFGVIYATIFVSEILSLWDVVSVGIVMVGLYSLRTRLGKN